jgi:hypothetical protein
MTMSLWSGLAVLSCALTARPPCEELTESARTSGYDETGNKDNHELILSCSNYQKPRHSDALKLR